jgi:hypothetical protein
MSDNQRGERENVRHLSDTMSDMKKLTRKVSFRVSEEMGEWMDAAGADAVREAIRARMEPVAARTTSDWSKGEDREQFLEDRPRTSLVEEVMRKADVPVWKAKLERQLAEKEAREASSALSGSAAPAAVASVSAPRSVVFRQSEAERARKLALARSAATGMKMQPQMVKPVDPHESGDPEPPEE